MKWTPRLDSAHQIGLSTSSKGKLIIVGECVMWGGFENRENRKNRKRFCLLRKNRWCYDEMDTTVGFSASNRSIYILKREANSSCRMCYRGGGLKIRKIEKIGNGFACYGRTSGAIMKRTSRLDSAHQIGLSTSSKGKLMVVGECVKRVFEKSEKSK